MADQKYALLVDYTYFSGNHAAEIACKEELGLPLDQFGIKEVEVGPFRKAEGSDGDAWETRPASVPWPSRSRSPRPCTTARSRRCRPRWRSSTARWSCSSCKPIML